MSTIPNIEFLEKRQEWLQEQGDGPRGGYQEKDICHDERGEYVVAESEMGDGLVEILKYKKYLPESLQLHD